VSEIKACPGRGSKTKSPCLKPAEVQIRDIPFCEPCAREQEAYFAIGELTMGRLRFPSKPLAEVLGRMRSESSRVASSHRRGKGTRSTNPSKSRVGESSCRAWRSLGRRNPRGGSRGGGEGYQELGPPVCQERSGRPELGVYRSRFEPLSYLLGPAGPQGAVPQLQRPSRRL
jgi:hypothetical protein